MDMTMQRATRGRPSGHAAWYVAGAAVVALAGWSAASWAARPEAAIVQGAQSLAALHVGLWNRVVRVTARTAAGPLKLRPVGDRLWPAGLVAPGTAVTLDAVVSGPTWDLFGTSSTRTTIVTPKDPALNVSRLQLAVGHPVEIGLSAASWGLLVRGLGSGWKALAGLHTSWTLHQTPTGPGQQGVVLVKTRARSWETPSHAYRLVWDTAPWLKVEAAAPYTVSPGSPLTVTFSGPVDNVPAADFTWSPSLSGTWRQTGPETMQFTPAAGQTWWPDETVALTVAGGRTGVQSTSGTYLASSQSLTWQLPQGTTLRLQELLADLGYLPFRFHSSSAPVALTTSAQIAAAQNTPTGTFQWRYGHIPASLAASWMPGNNTVMTQGALMTFEAQHNLPIDGVASGADWQALITALLNHQVDKAPYTYIYVSETLPEQLSVWDNGKVVYQSLANTGIPQAPTAPGTYPVYLRYTSQTMSGVNPNGTPYDDPGVPWVNYFNGGDAVHGFVRASYGFPQSLGCVELPPPHAAIVWTYIQYGTLVTVEPPGSARAPVAQAK